MLYDPKWEKQAETKQPSMADFISWLETKNPLDRYDFDNCAGLCLIGQYMAYHGHKWSDNRYREFSGIVGGGKCWTSVPVAICTPHTFGAALAPELALRSADFCYPQVTSETENERMAANRDGPQG